MSYLSHNWYDWICPGCLAKIRVTGAQINGGLRLCSACKYGGKRRMEMKMNDNVYPPSDGRSSPNGFILWCVAMTLYGEWCRAAGKAPIAWDQISENTHRGWFAVARFVVESIED